MNGANGRSCAVVIDEIRRPATQWPRPFLGAGQKIGFAELLFSETSRASVRAHARRLLRRGGGCWRFGTGLFRRQGLEVLPVAAEAQEQERT